MTENAEFTAAYVFAHLKSRDPRLWRGSRVQGSLRLEPGEVEALPAAELLRHYQLKGVGRDSQAGLLGWLEGRYPLDLREDIPSPHEMLEVQCRGRRYVTLMQRPEQQFVRYGRHKGALEFLLHDLEHAHKFFGEPLLQRGQQRFFRLLAQEMSRLHTLSQEESFQHELNYLMADMNSHPLHLLKYLKAIVLNACKRTGRQDYDPFCSALFAAWQMPEAVRAAADRINSPGQESAVDHELLANWFFTF
ncbi:MAG: hypothetical protein KF799_04580 [Bdellovibrionales bacterium]|nr:hypothetical protein [Bdellovibrionales bacterium]